MNYGFTYAGTVEANQDPLKLGRLKVRVPLVYGALGAGMGAIAVNDLPWALPAGMPAGNSASSGGFSQLPEPGDSVWVRFLDGEPEKPIWEWAMQTTAGRDALPLHKYAQGKPDRAFWTRYGHAIEINDGAVILTTASGYRLLALDADTGEANGKLSLTTKSGNFIEIDDLDDTIKCMAMEDLYFYVGTSAFGQSDSFSWETLTQDFTVKAGGAFAVTATDDLDLNTASNFSLNALGSAALTAESSFLIDFTSLQLGATATEPAVLGTQLYNFLTSLLLWLSTNTHTSSVPGSPTSPPVVPPQPVIQPDPSQLLSKSILLQ